MTGILNWATGYHTTSRAMKEEIIARGRYWPGKNKFTDEDMDHRFQVRDAVLKQVYAQRKITLDQLRKVKDIDIDYKNQLIIFSIPDTNHREAVHFEDITDRTAISSLNYLIGRANIFFNRSIPMIGSMKTKGNLRGPTSLERKSKAAEALTKDFAEARQTVVPEMLAGTPDHAPSRQKIVKRIEHAEFIAHRMKNQQGLKEQFENLDVYALTLALTTLSHLEATTRMILKKPQRRLNSEFEPILKHVLQNHGSLGKKMGSTKLMKHTSKVLSVFCTNREGNMQCTAKSSTCTWRGKALKI